MIWCYIKLTLLSIWILKISSPNMNLSELNWITKSHNYNNTWTELVQVWYDVVVWCDVMWCDGFGCFELGLLSWRCLNWCCYVWCSSCCYCCLSCYYYFEFLNFDCQLTSVNVIITHQVILFELVWLKDLGFNLNQLNVHI